MNLKECMEKDGITQMALADRLGIAQGMISKYLNGKAVPRPLYVHKLKSYFPELSIDSFYKINNN